ncbi:MAG: translocation protein TolB [Bdellovibrionaceae bacterium]|nr:translocation protein TolB [Pseudobdellovibrionaceae bacterium]
MKYIFLLFVQIPVVSALAQSPYIKIGDARAKKSVLAFPPLNYLGAPAVARNHQRVGTELFDVISNNLNTSSYFHILPRSAHIEDTSNKSLKPAPADPNGFNFQSWSTIGTDFLIRGGYHLSGETLTAEFYVYNVPKASLVLGNKYKAPASEVRKLAHTFSDDVLKAITGVRGPFQTKIAVASDRGGGKAREIWLMDWDGANPDKLTNFKTILRSPAWSPDGRLLGFSGLVSKAGLGRNNYAVIYDFDRKVFRLLSSRDGINSGINFHPNGTDIFLTMSFEGEADIYRMDSSGKSIVNLTRGPGSALNVEPAVSPDGKKIAFSSTRSGNPHIFVLDLSTGKIQRITFAGKYNSSPAWSPDGKKIAFAGQDKSNYDIFVVDADGTNMIRITKATRFDGRPADNEDPCFSPDGRFIMYTSDRTGKNQIFISTADGAEERRLTYDNFNYYRPKWSPWLD